VFRASATRTASSRVRKWPTWTRYTVAATWPCREAAPLAAACAPAAGLEDGGAWTAAGAAGAPPEGAGACCAAAPAAGPDDAAGARLAAWFAVWAGEGESTTGAGRSEERRVGKECRSRWSRDQ